MSKNSNERGFVHINGPDDNGTVEYDGRKDEKGEHRRLERISRLLGVGTVDFLSQKHVMVFGVGGVGSFAAESLVRSGIGKITIVDFDRVCETNINRQLPALATTVGEYKVDVLVDRFSKINPDGHFVGRRALYHRGTSDNLLQDVDYVIDAIDNVTAKLHLIATCLERKIPIVASMGAGGKMDPTRVKVTDLSRTHSDGLARAVRRLLRQEYGLDTSRKIGVPAVFSDESRIGPIPLPTDEEGVTLPQGTMCPVTATFGLVASSVVIQRLFIEHKKLPPIL